jgi:flagella basal body P-ring formation protein FlgA
MLEHGWRLTFGLDPLIAQARKRARRRWTLLAVAFALGITGGGGTAAGVFAFHHHGASSIEPVRVLVAKNLIQKGTTGNAIRTARLYKLVAIPSNAVEDGAIVNAAALANKVVQLDLSPGQQITAADFNPPVYVSAPPCPCQPVADVQVIVAIKPIRKGTRGDAIRADGDYKVVTIRKSQLVDGAITKLASLSGEETRKPIPLGAQLTSADFR